MATAEQIEADYQSKIAQRKTSRAAKRVSSPETYPAFISDHETYRPAEIKRRLGLGRDWLREARKNGLPVTMIGNNRILVNGQQLRLYLAKLEKSSSG